MKCKSAVIPTIGFNIETVYIKNKKVAVFDIGGRFRRFWDTYYEQTDIIIYVVDANDYEKLQLSKSILKRLRKKLPETPLLILANKCDISTSLDAKFLSAMLTHSETLRTSTLSGKGIKDVNNWICKTLECS